MLRLYGAEAGIINYMIYGNTEGIRKVVLSELEALPTEYGKDTFIDAELTAVLCRLTAQLGRELCVFLSRGGRLLAVGIGDSSKVPIKSFNERRGTGRLSGVRCIHTHPGKDSTLSPADESALIINRLDAIAAISTEGGVPGEISVAVIREGKTDIVYSGEFDEFDEEALFAAVIEADKPKKTEETKDRNQFAVLVSASGKEKAEYSLEELKQLAETAGITAVDSMLQKRGVPDKEYYIGSGKLEELRMLCQVKRAGMVIFDEGLSSLQHKRLEEELNLIVIDRSTLILDIFAKHATTNEGKLQVKLAKLKYDLPKMIGMEVGLSRQGGGFRALSGAGETKLEYDRRQVKEQIRELEEKIEKLKQQRDTRRERRNGSKSVAIVGYTNSGKSTLMNAVTKAGVLEADMLFATLDPVTRSVYAGEGKSYMLTDTVGFISGLPHEFIEAFKSTLDEARYADLLLHVVDAANPEHAEQIKVVKEVLSGIGAGGIPTVLVYNKIDKASNLAGGEGPDFVRVSAKTGEGLDLLKKKISEKLFGAD